MEDAGGEGGIRLEGGGLLIWGTFQTLVRTPAVGPSVLRSGSLKLGAGSGRQ